MPYSDAVLIAAKIEYDFSNVPEDNDILPQIATEFSDYCHKIYKIMKMNGIKNIEPLVKYFQPAFNLSVDTV
jgi:CRISPR/Cas system CMR-associated protein Cmr5 small subunit